MPILLDPHDYYFPDHGQADEHGIVAVGGDFRPERLLAAYYAGIFPWPHQNLPLLWFSPDPRFVLKPSELIINRSLAKAIRQSTLRIQADTNFLAVIKNCQSANRSHQKATWISDEMIDGYLALHNLGFAHSIEAYDQERLVGGLYGINIGSMFFGESMFFISSNASKIAFVCLVAHLQSWQFSLIDCQSHTEHLEKFGAHAISRDLFLAELANSHLYPTKQGHWQFYLTPKQAVEYLSPWVSLKKIT